MTTTEEGARMELEPPGPVSQAEQDSWLRRAQTAVDIPRTRTFDPAAPISLRTRAMFEASNALCQDRVPWWWGGKRAPIGETRHWGFAFHWGK